MVQTTLKVHDIASIILFKCKELHILFKSCLLCGALFPAIMYKVNMSIRPSLLPALLIVLIFIFFCFSSSLIKYIKNCIQKSHNYYCVFCLFLLLDVNSCLFIFDTMLRLQLKLMGCNVYIEIEIIYQYMSCSHLPIFLTHLQWVTIPLVCMFLVSTVCISCIYISWLYSLRSLRRLASNKHT